METPNEKAEPTKMKQKEIESLPTPDMPLWMKERITEMRGNQIKLVIQKQLQKTDVSKNQGRLSFLLNKLKFDFATEEEEKLLDEEDNKNKKGMDVLILDPLMRESFICLKKWKMGRQGHAYCLTTNWNSFVEKNSLKSGDLIQLWSFRKDGFDAVTETNTFDLCFAMIKLDIRTLLDEQLP